MALETHILDANRKLARHTSQLLTIAPLAARKAAELLNADGIDVSISPFKPGDAPASGIGGYSFSPYRIELLLDSEREDLSEVIARELPAVLGHEMHHCVRSLSNPNPLTLGECITTEGLATHFELQMNGGELPSLFNSFPDVHWRELLEKAQPLLEEKVFSFTDWFLGTDPERLPKYTGYLIGFKAVSHYKISKQYSDLEMMNLTADELFKCMKVDFV